MSRRQTSPAGLALLESFESFQPTRYLCPAHKPTIGFGHVIRTGESIPERLTIEQARDLMREDLAPVEIYLNAVFPDLTQGAFDALASFAFNVGLHAFECSTLFLKLKAGDPAGAAEQFGRWVIGGGRVLPGLVKRREAERARFLAQEG